MYMYCYSNKGSIYAKGLCTSPSLRFVRFPRLQIFVELFRRNLEPIMPLWKRHVGAPAWYTNMAAGKYCKHLELTLAIKETDYLY